MSALIESLLYGDDSYAEQPNAIIVWLSDSPQLNEQSKLKIDSKADKIRLSQCDTILEESFDKESFEDGHIYFLNTQKLSVSSKLTKLGDGRAHTIWETLANTVRDKSDRLYFIIDEAHRGMQGQEASKATTIMQKFIKGSEADGIPPMPVVIGMSATTQRFNTLVEGTASTIYKSIVTADEVRTSGLLKDRVVITYPEEGAVNNDMAILQAAADDWKEKWEHWTQYCYEQHYAYVNPVLIIQVLNGSGSKLTDTNLDDCLAKIEERAGVKFENGQVVHTFGGTATSIMVNGLEVRYEEPSRIADDRNIRVVFFKENLSTGWDCPRAETMMSFRHATDATYIAQLLGRMVRTPMQMHIQVDEVLNDVHLYLPYFNEATVKDVVEALQSAEGSNIPTDIYGEPVSGKTFDTLTVKPKKKDKVYPGQMSIDDFINPTAVSSDNPTVTSNPENDSEAQKQKQQNQFVVQNKPFQDTTEPDGHENMISTNQDKHGQDEVQESVQQSQQLENPGSDVQNIKAEAPEITHEEEPEQEEDLFDRETVMKFINDAGLLSYNVRSLRINDYLKSLYRIAHFLSISKLHREAIREVQNDIAVMIHNYVEDLKAKKKYDELVKQVKQFKLATQIFDAFGETVDNYSVHDLFTTTDTDIERQFQIADIKLGREGIGLTYINKYADMHDLAQYKVDVILFVADEEITYICRETFPWLKRRL